MCIICNLLHPEDDLWLADSFLHHFAEAGKAMHEAEAALLAVSDKVGPADRKRYRQLHKKMVRLRRDWNRLQEERERGGDEPHAAMIVEPPLAGQATARHDPRHYDSAELADRAAAAVGPAHSYKYADQIHGTDDDSEVDGE